MRMRLQRVEAVLKLAFEECLPRLLVLERDK
jgi:hypothetical protein